jgi:hypothetical protein
MKSKTPKGPPQSTPMCDEARKIHDFKERLRHYHCCDDERCVARSAAARILALAIGGSIKKGDDS